MRRSIFRRTLRAAVLLVSKTHSSELDDVRIPSCDLAISGEAMPRRGRDVSMSSSRSWGSCFAGEMEFLAHSNIVTCCTSGEVSSCELVNEQSLLLRCSSYRGSCMRLAMLRSRSDLWHIFQVPRSSLSLWFGNHFFSQSDLGPYLIVRFPLVNHKFRLQQQKSSISKSSNNLQTNKA